MRAGPTDGFTLIEMLAALTIAAIAMAVIAGNPFGRTRQETPAALARQIAILAARLEAQAVAKAAPQSITVNVADRTVTIGGTRIEIPQNFSISVKTGLELIEQDNKGSILVFPDGTSSGGEITLEGRPGTGAAVRINWLTGAVELAGEAP
ncbi:MAG: prepilin-type N-terminal cleavage/methylation domain-containing protein [Rhizobiaceae bacterium]